MDIDSSKTEDIWAGDCLERRNDAETLVTFLTTRMHERNAEGKRGAYVLNLDSAWGKGKTFFLERLQKQLDKDGFLAAYVNAWRDDSGGEPLTAVLTAIEDVAEPYLHRNRAARKYWDAARSAGGRLLVAAAKGALTKAAEKVMGEGLNEVAEIVHDTALGASKASQEIAAAAGGEAGKAIGDGADRLMTRRMDEYRQRQKSVQSFKEALGRLTASLERREENADAPRWPLFVLIDELDRCRPSYAISLLEEVKHLFDIDGTVFVVATDSSQLAHAVRAVYGAGFDGTRYLRRFFDRSYMFDEPKIDQLVDALFAAHPTLDGVLSVPLNQRPRQFFAFSMQRHDLSIRDAEQCFDILRSFVSAWPHQPKSGRLLPVEMLCLMPLIIAWQQGRSEEFDSLARLEANELRGVGISYKEVMGLRDRDGRPIPAEEIPEMSSAEKNLLSLLRQPLPKIVETVRTDRQPIFANWLRARFQEEMSVLHNNTWSSEQPPLSVMRQYPRLVRGISRLTR